MAQEISVLKNIGIRVKDFKREDKKLLTILVNGVIIGV